MKDPVRMSPLNIPRVRKASHELGWSQYWRWQTGEDGKARSLLVRRGLWTHHAWNPATKHPLETQDMPGREPNSLNGEPGCMTHYKVTVVKTVWCWHKDRQTDPWTRKGSRMNTSPLWAIDFRKGEETIQWGKNHFSTNCIRTTKCPYAKEWNWIPSLYHIQTLININNKSK